MKTRKPARRSARSTRRSFFGHDSTQTRPTSFAHRALRVEQLEDRRLLVVGAFGIPDTINPGEGYDGVVAMDFGTTSTPTILTNGCTASLLYTGRHVVTAAHCTDFNLDGTPDFGTANMVFDMPNQNYVVPVTTADTSVPAAWDGVGFDGDVAVIELPFIAPFPAERFQIYRATDEDGQRYVHAGYGNTGTGATGSLPSFSGATKRLGHNEFDVNGTLLDADFDDGSAANNSLGDSLGLGNSETTGAQGDSGSPAFLAGPFIAGINSITRSQFGNAGVRDDFGDQNGWTRVSSFAAFIDGVLDDPGDIVLDMNFQPAGNDGVADHITVRRDPNNAARLQILIGEQEVWSDLFTRATSVAILGSGDDDILNVDYSNGIPVPAGGLDFDGRSPSASDTFVVTGTNGSDDIDVEIIDNNSADVVVNGGATIDVDNAELLRIDGNSTDNGNPDTLNYSGIFEGTNRIVFTPGNVADAGTITGFDFFGGAPSHLPVEFLNIQSSGTLDIDSNSPGFGDSVLVIQGTSGSDRVEVSGADGDIQLTTGVAGPHVAITTTDFGGPPGGLIIETYEGDDDIVIGAGVNAYGQIEVRGGDPASGSDNLVVTANSATIDFLTKLITFPAGVDPISIEGVEHVRLDGTVGAGDGFDILNYGLPTDVTLLELFEANQAAVRTGDAPFVQADTLRFYPFTNRSARMERAEGGPVIDIIQYNPDASVELGAATQAADDRLEVIGGHDRDLFRAFRSQPSPGDAVQVTTTLAVGTLDQTDGVRIIFQTSVESLALIGRSGADTFLIDEVNGLLGGLSAGVGSSTILRSGIVVDGGDGSDRLEFAGATAVNAAYSPGPIPGEGFVTHAIAANTQLVHFYNLEPVFDPVPGPLVINANNADNAINYSQGTVAANGLVSIDAQETYEFTAKTTLTINALAGSDTINLNNPGTPTALTDITVNGGDPTSSDTVIVNGTDGADAINYTVTDFDSGTVLVNALPLVTLATTEHLTINGRTGSDDLTVTTPAGAQHITLTPGATADAGSVDLLEYAGGPTLLPLRYEDIGDAGSVTFASGGGTLDVLFLNGTEFDDRFVVAANGDLQILKSNLGFDDFTTVVLQTQVGAVQQVGQVSLRGFAGDDTFSIPGNHPFPGFGGTPGILVVAGDPSASDVVNFTGSATVANLISVDFAAHTVTEAPFAAVHLSGVELLSVAAATHDLTLLATAGDDRLTVTPTGDNAATATLNSSSPAIGSTPVVNGSNIGTLRVNLRDGSDHLVVNADQGHDTVTVTGLLVTVDENDAAAPAPRETVNYTETENLQVNGLAGNDTFLVTPAILTTIFIDGGDPIGTTPGDIIHFAPSGAFQFETGPEVDEGGFVEVDRQRVSWDHIEALVVSGGGPSKIFGTGGDDDITIIARDDSSHPLNIPLGLGNDDDPGVRDFTVQVNGGPAILFIDQAELFVDAGAGDDDIVLRTPAPNDAVWDVNVFIAGGAPAAATGDQGDVFELETPGTQTVDFTPTGIGTAIIDVVTLSSVITIGQFVCPVSGLLSSQGDVEEVVYDGQNGNDNLTVFGTADLNTIVHTAAALLDAGSFSIDDTLGALLGLRYENLGAGAVLTADGLGESDILVVRGTGLNDLLIAAATTGAVTLINSTGIRIDVNQANIETLTLDGLSGDDNFVVNNPQPYAFVFVNGGDPGGSDVLTVNGQVGVDEQFTVNPGFASGDGSVDIDVGPVSMPYQGIEHVLLDANGGDVDNLIVNDDEADNLWTVTAGPIVGDRVQIAGRESIDYDDFTDVTLNNTFGTDRFEIYPTELVGFSGDFTVNGNANTPIDDELALYGTPGNDVVDSPAVGAEVRINGVTITVGANLIEVEVHTLDGADNINLDLDLPGDDLTRKYVDAGAGDDIVDLAGSVDATIFGGLGDDFLIGTPDYDLIDGGPGNDFIFGLGNNDDLYGGDGNDLIVGGSGNDNMFGQEGSDTLVWNPGDGSDLFEGGEGQDILQFVGAAGADTFTLTANGTRLRFDRQPGNIIIDASGMEQVDINSSISFGGVLTGAQEVPPVATAATGRSALVFNSATGTFDLEVVVQGITLAQLTMAHIHQGAAGVNGPVIFDLGTALWSETGGAIRRTVHLGNFPAANISDLLAGNTYINIHTVANPTGEIRGQLLAVSGAPNLNGADTFTVNDLYPTDVSVVNLGLGIAEAAPNNDSVTIHGRNVSDEVNITNLNTTRVAVTGLRYDVNVDGAVAGQEDAFTFLANGGNDIVSTADDLSAFFTSTNSLATNRFTLNGGAGDDYLSTYGALIGGPGNDTLVGADFPSPPAAFPILNFGQVLQGDAGNDQLFGGTGDDALFGGDGEDLFVPGFDGQNDSVDGGLGFDTILVQGTSGNNRIDARQVDADTVQYEVSGIFGNGVLGGVETEDDTITFVEELKIVAGAGDDTIRVAHADVLVAAGIVANMLRFTVEGGAPGASDRLTVTDDGDGDTTVHRVGGIAGDGSYQMYAWENGVIDNPIVGLPPVVYFGIEFASLNPIDSVTGGTGTDGNGRLFVFKHDPLEENNSRLNATFLGSNDAINIDPVIDPGPDLDFELPGDEDWYRVVAETTGTLDFRVFFRQQGILVNDRAGLPGQGDIQLEAYDTLGSPINTNPPGPGFFGDNESTAVAPYDEDERIRIPVVAGQTYYFRVFGEADAINVYNVTVLNAAPPTPYDLELVDILSTAAVSIAGDADTFRAPVAELQDALALDPALGVDITQANYFAGKDLNFVSGINIGQRSRIITSTLVGADIEFQVADPFGNPYTQTETPPVAGDEFFIESFDTGFSQFDDMTRDNTPVILIRLDDAIFLHDVPGNPDDGNPPDEITRVPFNDQQTRDTSAALGTIPGYRVAIFDEGEPQQSGGAPQQPIGYARQFFVNGNAVEGVYIFDFERDALSLGSPGNQPVAANPNGPPTFLNLSDGSHFLSAKVQMIDPNTDFDANPVLPGVQSPTGFGDRSVSLEIVVDTQTPPVFFGSPQLSTDGLHPDSDSGIINQPNLYIDRITNDVTPTLWGQAEANAVVKVWLDINGDGVVQQAIDVLIAQTQATPLGGTNQYPGGHWEATSTVNLNRQDIVDALIANGQLPPLDPADQFDPPDTGIDGLRHLIVTAEDVDGNISPVEMGINTLDIFLDTRGPQVEDVFVTDNPDYDLFDPKPSNDGPTPLVNSIDIDFIDRPRRGEGGGGAGMVDVFLLFDDTGSFAGTAPTVQAIFPQVIANLQAILGSANLAFGVGRLEEYGSFASENATGRPFTLNQPIIELTNPQFTAAIDSALLRTAPGFGGDGPETSIEALFQVATGNGYDGNNDGDNTDSGAAGLVSTQTLPGNSGDVPAFASFTPDAGGPTIAPAGNVGGVGFRPGAQRLVLLATDIAFAFQPDGLVNYTGVGGVQVPAADVQLNGRGSTPFGTGAQIQATIDALVANGIKVIGLGTNQNVNDDPRGPLEAVSILTGALNATPGNVDSGIPGDPILPGEPLYFFIDPVNADSIADAITSAVVAGAGSGFLYPAVNEVLATNTGHYDLIGDYNGHIPILQAEFIDHTVAGDYGRTTIRLHFRQPGADGVFNTSDDIGKALPDDRFTLTIKDGIADDAGNALDGETNAAEPHDQDNPPDDILGVQDDNGLGVPSGDNVPGGDFVGRFTVDTRPEMAVYAGGSVWVDANGNTTFDSNNPDFVNRDFAFVFGYTSDDLFSGQFASNVNDPDTPENETISDGFDKVGAYGRVGTTTYRWLIDTNNDGVPDIEALDPSNINGHPVAGDFGPFSGDEVGLFTGSVWHFDTNHDFDVDTQIPWVFAGKGIVGDFDGDGFDDLATWADDIFVVDLSSRGPAGPVAALNNPVSGTGVNGYVAGETPEATFRFGFIGVAERPVAADVNMDGIDDIGLWVPARDGITPREEAEWYFLVSGVTPNNTPEPPQAGTQNPPIGDHIGPSITGGNYPIGDPVTGDLGPGAYLAANTPSYLALGQTALDYGRGRIVVDPLFPGTNIVRYDPTPFGNDLYMQFGDEFALPLIGNFDPPAGLVGTGSLPSNTRDALDVNNDGFISPLDALIVINHMNASSGTTLAPTGNFVGAPYMDVNHDSYVSPVDALLVINYLNTDGEGEEAADAFFSELAEGEGEGEEAIAALAAGLLSPKKK